MTDWLRHEFEVSGRPGEVAAFRHGGGRCQHRALGSSTWRGGEEDWFLLIVRTAARGLGVGGARALAAQLRAAVDARHGALCAWIGRNHACPLDLHALVPVPSAILRRGPDDPASRAWLWGNWGTTEALRHVREIPARPGQRRGLARFRVEFYAADWTPWRALLAIRARWPSLRFEVWPDYDSDVGAIRQSR